MEDRIFKGLTAAYLGAIENAFEYCNDSFWLIRPILWLFALIYSACFLIVGIVFGILIILDFLGDVTDGLRETVAEWMEGVSRDIDDSLWTFLFFPIWLMILAPLFFLTLFIPKLSSDMDSLDDHEGLTDIIFAGGAFGKAGLILFKSSGRLFEYLPYANLLTWLPCLLIAVVYSLVFIVLSLCFFLLWPLDWISGLLDILRLMIIGIAEWLSESIEENFLGFFLSSFFLIVLAPVFLLLLFIPKLSGTPMDIEA